ncbi:phosphoglycerate mutase [Salegentibacter salinarum]|uniref:Phosphoglycerate mutase n=1 Tax=Salegentibacter salinarum TaxID=447422 RepID=A0A2N0TPF7_9FLAO|nr:phosphoglycerate mutase family protein [Salegentibacter salinarum]PKD16629.1 phosphoglycerate mutase [Salegentibacter salinarum]SKB61740.1 Histidine phosphatase superfamily (branch 1) [Salegentibacter salinarum]
MKRYLLVLCLIILTSCNFGDKEPEEIMEDAKDPSEEITTYYFIRHAEKDTTDTKNEDPDLTEAGRKRTQDWVKTFKDIDFDLVYSSDYKRTLNTAEPIADSKNKEVKFYNAEKLNDKDFQENTKNKTVLVVGHSNLNPEWVNYILGRKKYQDLDEKVYGSLFIVTIHPDDSRTSQVLYLN